MNEANEIMKLYKILVDSTKCIFPVNSDIKASEKHGVYIIYSPNNEVLHVGKTNDAKGGLNQRILNHMRNQSSFSKLYLKLYQVNLRNNGYYFKYVEVEDSRRRGLLEALASGLLCPLHFGTRERKKN